MKVKECQQCGVEMEVPPRSSRKWCDSCKVVKRRESVRKYYYRNQEECKRKSLERNLIKYREDDQLRLYKNSKSRATREGIEFNLSKDDIVIPERCPVLGVSFEYGTYHTMSLDRIVSTKGYVKGNIQVMSHKANAMKNSATPEELVKFSEWVLTTVKREPKMREAT